MAKAVTREPLLLARDPSASAPNVEYLLSLGMASNLGVAVARSPQLLTCNVHDDLHRKVAILTALGLTRPGKFIEKCPGFATLDVEADMRPAVEFLRSIPGLNVAKVLSGIPELAFRKHPHASRPSKLEAKADLLLEELDITRPELGTLLNRYPNVLKLSNSTIRAKVEWMRSVGMENVGRTTVKNPRVLATSLEALQQRHDFIVNVWKRAVADIESFPQVLTYSIEFLRKRHGFLKAAGRAELGRLHRLLRSPDTIFAKKLAKRTVEEYQRFVAPTGDDETDAGGLDAALPAGGSWEEVMALDKHFARQLEITRRDQAEVAAMEQLRSSVKGFFDGRSAAASPTPPADPGQAETDSVVEADAEELKEALGEGDSTSSSR